MSHVAAEDYLDLPYRVELIPDRDENGRRGWVASVAELPGCMSQGATPDEAIANLRDAMLGWISVAQEEGIEIPRPQEHRYSGRLVVRMAASLHADLARQAEREGVSLNQLVTGILAAGVGWRQTARGQREKGPRPRAARS